MIAPLRPVLRAALVLAPFALGAGAASQTEGPQPAEIFAEVMKAQDAVERPSLQGGADLIERIFESRRAEALAIAATEALREHKYRLRRGAALHYRGRLEILARKLPAAVASLDAHLATNPTGTLRARTLLFAAELAELYGAGPDQAMVLFDELDPELLEDEALGVRYRALAKYMEGLYARSQLRGRPAPPLDAYWVLGDDHQPQLGKDLDWSLQRFAGKPVLVCFFSPWMPLAQEVVFNALKLRAAHPETQVVLVTHRTGVAWEFAEGDPEPGAGKVIRAPDGKQLEIQMEVAYLSEFARRLGLQGVPVVVERPGMSRAAWHVALHPTVFVLSRDGRVVGHVTGHVPNDEDSPSSKRVEALLEKATEG